MTLTRVSSHSLWLESSHAVKTSSQPGMDLGSVGPRAILVFGAPRRCDLLGCLSEKREGMPLLCVVPRTLSESLQ